MTAEELEKYDIVMTSYEVCVKSEKIGNASQRILIKGEGFFEGKIVAYMQPQKEDIKPNIIGHELLHNYYWHRIVTDESQTLCNAKTKTFLAICSLVGKYKLCLTGTPIRNTDTDAWSLLFFCGYSKIDNPRKWKFEAFGQEERNMILSLDNNDHIIKLPPKITNMYEIYLNDNEKKIYKFYFMQLWAAYDRFIRKEDETGFAMLLGLFTRLRQICIAPFLMTNESKNLVYMKHDPLVPLDIEGSTDPELARLGSVIRDSNVSGFMSTKLGSIINLIYTITNGTDNSVIVFSSFSSALRLISIFFTHNKIPNELVDGKVIGKLRQTKLNKFRNGECRILLMNYKVGAQGLNLTKANHVITIEPWWSPVIESQAESRSHRTGQTREVTVHRVIVAGTIEKQIYEIGLAKMSILDSYIDISKSKDRKAVPKLDKETLGKILQSAYKDILNIAPSLTALGGLEGGGVGGRIY
jgi:SNF2 family DNA or RNA helicase